MLLTKIASSEAMGDSIATPNITDNRCDLDDARDSLSYHQGRFQGLNLDIEGKPHTWKLDVLLRGKQSSMSVCLVPAGWRLLFSSLVSLPDLIPSFKTLMKS